MRKSLSRLALTSALLSIGLGLAGCKDDKPTTVCDLAAPACDDGFVCLQLNADEDPMCTEVCDPSLADSCADFGDNGGVCNPLTTGEFACFDPVYLEGRVFDLEDDSNIGDAQVMAADGTGTVVSQVAVTAADGTYQLSVPVTRNPDGSLVSADFTLRVTAADYSPFPSGTRVAIPVSSTEAVFDDEAGEFVLSNGATDVALIGLETTGLFSISGTVGGDSPSGALVVAECPEGERPCPYAYADANGEYTIFNVADGTYDVMVYRQGLDIVTESVTIAGADLTDVGLEAGTNGLYTITGSINPVEGAGATSVVLVPLGTFETVPITLADGTTVLDEVIVRGQVAQGLRAPEPGMAPNITGSYTIEGVPAGDYAVLAGFENDGVSRDPDFNQAGTEIAYISIPSDITDGTTTLDVTTVTDAFKVNPALEITGPGADGPTPITSGSDINFTWVDDSGESHYELFLIDSLGTVVWQATTVEQNITTWAYDGPALEVGRYYQWRVLSIAATGGQTPTFFPIAASEDLRGVFYIVEAAP